MIFKDSKMYQTSTIWHLRAFPPNNSESQVQYNSNELTIPGGIIPGGIIPGGIIPGGMIPGGIIPGGGGGGGLNLW